MGKWIKSCSLEEPLITKHLLTYPDGIKEKLFSEAMKHQIGVEKAMMDPTGRS